MVIGIIFAVVLSVHGDRFVRSKYLKPNVKIMVKTELIVIIFAYRVLHTTLHTLIRAIK